MQLATDEANKMYDEKVEELTKQISESLMFGIVKTVGLVTASALENQCGFGVKRIGRVVGDQLQYITDMSNPRLSKVNILEHERYWAEKGFHIEENEKGETAIRIGR